MAHPDVTRAWALKILEKTNYLFISVTALADAELEAAINECALKNNTRAYVPHGGVVGETIPTRARAHTLAPARARETRQAVL